MVHKMANKYTQIQEKMTAINDYVYGFKELIDDLNYIADEIIDKARDDEAERLWLIYRKNGDLYKIVDIEFQDIYGAVCWGVQTKDDLKSWLKNKKPIIEDLNRVRAAEAAYKKLVVSFERRFKADHDFPALIKECQEACQKIKDKNKKDNIKADLSDFIKYAESHHKGKWKLKYGT
jgi:hypothetical protein